MKAMNGWRVFFFFSSFTPKKFCVMLCKKVIENIVDIPVPFFIFGILILKYLSSSIYRVYIMPKWNLAFGRCNQDLPNTIRNCNLTVDLKSYSAIRF